MRAQLIKVLLTVVLFTTINNCAFSQGLSLDSDSSPAIKNLVYQYNQTLAPQLHIFNGKEYRHFKKTIANGHVFFAVDTLTSGTVTYEGTEYENVPLMYDITTDQLVILNYNSTARIQLIKEKVQAFSYLNYAFVNIAPDTLNSSGVTPGYYQVITPGKTTLLARRMKKIETEIKQTVEYKVYAKDFYYLKKNNSYKTINSKKSFLKEFSDHGKEVQQYIRQNNLNFKKRREDYLAKVVAYYNSITNY